MKVDFKSMLWGAVLVFTGYIMGAYDFGRLVAQDSSIPPPGFHFVSPQDSAPVAQDLPYNIPTEVGRFFLAERFSVGYGIFDTKTGDYFNFSTMEGGWRRIAPSLPSHLSASPIKFD